MKLAIMQPYFFPYVGYFQYIAASDKFIFYNDVSFIMRGWINRNYITLNGEKHLFTVPLIKASPNKLINETFLKKDIIWKNNFKNTLFHAYHKSKYFDEVSNIIFKIIDSECNTIDKLATTSIIYVLKYLNIEKNLILSSTVYNNAQMKSDERIIDILKKETIDTCIVPYGGRGLYDKVKFKEYGISLYYLKPIIKEYDQKLKSFLPSLSIIDVLMFNAKERIKEMLNEFELI